MYYEDKKVISAERNSEEKLVRITTEEEAFDAVEWEYDVNCDENTIDASTARNNRGVYVADKIYDLLKSLDVRTDEIPFYIQKLTGRLVGTEEAAIISAFGKTQDDNLRLSDWEKKL